MNGTNGPYKAHKQWMLVLLGLALFCLAQADDSLASLTVTPGPQEQIGPGMENKVNRPGSDYDRFHINDHRPDRCQSECQRQNDRCKAWAYVRPGIQHKYAVCYLKHAVPSPVRDACCISGVPANASKSKVTETPGGAVAEPPINSPPRIPFPDPAPDDPSPSSPANCMPGFERREARPTDYVCVTPESRSTVKQENAIAHTRRNPSGPYGSHTCISGFVWREAFDGDVVLKDA